MTTTAGDHGAPRRLRDLLVQGAGTLLALVLLPLCLALGVPFEAWAIAFGLVLANRVIQAIVVRSVRDSNLTVQLGTLGFSTIFRALATALVLFFVGASVAGSGDRPVGLDRPDLAKPALIIFILCFTLDAAVETIRRAGEREELLAADHATSHAQETPA
jgi:hypothetical protein